MCKNFREKGFCKYEQKCLFAHGEHELTRKSDETTEKIETPVKTEIIET